MAAPVTSGSALATELFALGTLEKQTMFLLVRIASLENTFNTSNPSALSNRATVAPNYDQRLVTGQLTLTLSDSSIEGKLVDGCQPFLP